MYGIWENMFLWGKSRAFLFVLPPTFSLAELAYAVSYTEAAMHVAY